MAVATPDALKGLSLFPTEDPVPAEYSFDRRQTFDSTAGTGATARPYHSMPPLTASIWPVM
jgi:hypothetical protein